MPNWKRILKLLAVIRTILTPPEAKILITPMVVIPIIVQVYPTQVADYVHVGVLPAKSRLILFDFTGKQVKQVSSCEGNVDLFMGDQPSGFYLLHILAGDEQKKTVKLIKK